MQFAAFASSFFDQTVAFTLANLQDGQHGGTTEGQPWAVTFAPNTSTGGAFVEPDTDRSRRTDDHGPRGHGQPISRKRWRIFTPTSPAAAIGTVNGLGLGLDDAAQWGGLAFRILKEPYDASQGSGVLWCTEVEELGPEGS